MEDKDIVYVKLIKERKPDYWYIINALIVGAIGNILGGFIRLFLGGGS